MNLTPVNSDDRYIIYQIEKLDYATAGPDGIINRQPQSILNTITYVNSVKESDIGSYYDLISLSISSLDSTLDDIEDSISELEDQEDVVDIVTDYSALQNYDTSHLNNGDIVKVLADINYDNAPSYYKWNGISFVFVNYEVDFPHILVSTDISVTPSDDMTYIAMSNITITLNTSGIMNGSIVHIVASSSITTYCTVIFGNNSIKLYSNMNCELIFYNGEWYSYNYEYIQHKVGDIVLHTSNVCPFSYGTWELLEEGCALVSGDENNVTGESVGSNSVTFTPSYETTSGSTTIQVANLPSHRHIIYVSAASASHTHTYGLTTLSATGGKYSNVYGINKTQSNASGSGTTGSHQHTVTAYVGNSTVYSASPSGHTHSISNVADVTISTMQASVAYYAWKRTA